VPDVLGHKFSNITPGLRADRTAYRFSLVRLGSPVEPNRRKSEEALLGGVVTWLFAYAVCSRPGRKGPPAGGGCWPRQPGVALTPGAGVESLDGKRSILSRAAAGLLGSIGIVHTPKRVSPCVKISTTGLFQWNVFGG